MMSMERRGDITDIGVFSNRNNLFSSNSEANAVKNLPELLYFRIVESMAMTDLRGS